MAVLYRVMRADPDDGLPIVVAGKRWALGVRTDGPRPDIVPTDGIVGPLTGGLTCAYDWRTFEPGMLPKPFGGTARHEVLFEIDEELARHALGVRKDEPPPGHHVLEPRHRMPIEKYEALLAATRRGWRRVPEP